MTSEWLMSIGLDRWSLPLPKQQTKCVNLYLNFLIKYLKKIFLEKVVLNTDGVHFRNVKIMIHRSLYLFAKAMICANSNKRTVHMNPIVI